MWGNSNLKQILLSILCQFTEFGIISLNAKEVAKQTDVSFTLDISHDEEGYMTTGQVLNLDGTNKYLCGHSPYYLANERMLKISNQKVSLSQFYENYSCFTILVKTCVKLIDL